MMPRSRDEDFEEFVIDIDEPVYTSGVICRLLGIPVHVLKLLDQEKIVRPPRKKGKGRLYSKRDLKKLRRCWYYISEKRVKVYGLRVILEIEERNEEG